MASFKNDGATTSIKELARRWERPSVPVQQSADMLASVVDH